MNKKDLHLNFSSHLSNISQTSPETSQAVSGTKFLPELVLPSKSKISLQVLKTKPTPNPVDKSKSSKPTSSKSQKKKRSEKSASRSRSPVPSAKTPIQEPKQIVGSEIIDKTALISIENERLKMELERLGSENERFRNDCEGLFNENERLRIENNKMRADLVRFGGNNDKEREEIDSLMKEIDRERQRNREYGGIIKDLRTKNDELERALLDFDPDSKKQFEREIKKLRDEARMAKLDGEKARDQAIDLERESRKMEGKLLEAQREKENLKRANEALKETIARQKEQIDKMTKDQMEFGDKQAQNFQAELQQLRNLLAKERDQRVEIENQNRSLRNENSAHEKRAGNAGNFKIKALEEEIKEKNRLLEAQKARIDRQDAKIRQLHVDLGNKDYSDLSESTRNMLKRIRELEEANQRLDDANMMLQHGLHLGGSKIIRKKEKLQNLAHENSQLKIQILENSSVSPLEVSAIKEGLNRLLKKSSVSGSEIDDYKAATDSYKKKAAMASNIGHFKRERDPQTSGFSGEGSNTGSSLVSRAYEQEDNERSGLESTKKGVSYGASTSGYGPKGMSRELDISRETYGNNGMRQSKASDFESPDERKETSYRRRSISPLAKSRELLSSDSGLQHFNSKISPSRVDSVEYNITPPNASFLE